MRLSSQRIPVGQLCLEDEEDAEGGPIASHSWMSTTLYNAAHATAILTVARRVVAGVVDMEQPAQEQGTARRIAGEEA